jgi:DNA-binding XRE family transcriptional regulator
VTAKRRKLAERRKVVGYTQEQLAEVLDVERSTVVRWEAGETTPQPWCRPKLAEALAVSLDELDTMLTNGGMVEGSADSDESLPDDDGYDPVLASPWSYRGTVEVARVLSGGDGRVKRRAFLLLSGTALTALAHQWLVHEPERLMSGLSGRRISVGMAHQLTAMIAELRKMDDIAGGGSVLTLAQQEFTWVAQLLDQATYDEETGQALLVVLAELGQFCGWSAYDVGHHGLSQRFSIAALRAAHSADDRPLGAHILASMANQAARYGRPADAVTLIETALAGTRGRQTPALLAQLHMRHAYAFARLGDSSACTKAITRARTQVEQLRPEDDPPWLYWVSVPGIMVNTGDCLLQIGRFDQAAVMLAEGVGQFNESFVRDRQIYTTHLANALARPGKQQDLDVAAGLGMESIELAESLDSNTGLGYLHDLYHQLKSYATVPAVRDFLDRARSLIAV